MILIGEVIIGETSNNKFQKIKLSNHGKLKIIAYNEFGTYASINISVKVNYRILTYFRNMFIYIR